MRPRRSKRLASRVASQSAALRAYPCRSERRWKSIDFPSFSEKIAATGIGSYPIDARSTVLAGQPIGLLHPVQIDDVVQRAESYPRFRPRQFGYPLPVRGQVCRAQSPLPCFASTVLYSWRFPSLGRVSMSAVPRRYRNYGGATTSRPRIPDRLLVSLPGPTPSFLASCLAAALLSRREGRPRPGSVVPPATHFRLLRTWT